VARMAARRAREIGRRGETGVIVMAARITSRALNAK